MSNDHEISVKITEETMHNVLEKNKDYINFNIVDKDTDLEYSVDDLKDTVENLEYELQELKDRTDDDRMDSSDLKGDYNDLDDRLSELQNTIEGFEEHFHKFKDQLTAIDEQCAAMEKNSLEKVKLITDIAVNFERLAKNIYQND